MIDTKQVYQSPEGDGVEKKRPHRTVKTWKLTEGSMVERSIAAGSVYVSYDDYKALRAERDALKSRVEELEKLNDLRARAQASQFQRAERELHHAAQAEADLAREKQENEMLRAVISTPEVYAGVVSEETEKHFAALLARETERSARLGELLSDARDWIVMSSTAASEYGLEVRRQLKTRISEALKESR